MIDSNSNLDHDLENRFNYHPPYGDKKERHEAIREECRLLAYTLKERMPAGREASLALTKLEEAMFWANAAIARDD